MSVVDERIIYIIGESDDKRPTVDWEPMYGLKFMDSTNTTWLTVVVLVVDVCFCSERRLVWYRWVMPWLDDEPNYNRISEGNLGSKWEKDSEFLRISPSHCK